MQYIDESRARKQFVFSITSNQQIARANQTLARFVNKNSIKNKMIWMRGPAKMSDDLSPNFLFKYRLLVEEFKQINTSQGAELADVI